MWIELMGVVRIEAEDANSPVINLLRQEYKPYILESDFGVKADIIVTMREDAKTHDFYRVKSPISFDEEGVFLFDSRYRVCRLDWDRIGLDGVRVQCDPAFNPHFFAIIIEYLVHMRFVRKGAFFCHASAFEWQGKVVLCPAWRNVGKTNLLLSLLEKGARYIADDWALIDAGGRIRSLPKRLNLFHYNFEQHPGLAERLPVDLKHLVGFTMNAIGGQYDLDHGVVEILRKKLRVRICPEELTEHLPLLEAEKIDYVFSLRLSTIESVQANISELDRDVFLSVTEETLHYEQRLFHMGYQVYKAKSGRVNPFLETYDEHLRALMHSAFTGIEHFYQIYTLGQKQVPDVERLILDFLEGKGEVHRAH